MATKKATTAKPTTAKSKKPAAAKPLTALAPPKPATPETVVSAVRRQLPAIIAAWVEGHTLNDIGGSLDPMLSGFEISRAMFEDADLEKVWLAAKDERAHQLIDSAGSWASIMGGKDGVDSKLKVAAILAPKLYGSKSTVEHTGKVDAAVTVTLDPIEAYKKMCGGS